MPEKRKPKQPHKLTLHEQENKLNIAFRTNFRLDRDETFLTGIILSLMFTFATLASIGNAPLIVMAGLVLVTLLSYYWLALTVFNKTVIQVNDDEIRVSRQPIPNPLGHENTISLYNVASILYDETPISKREGYDTPRYRVWAETPDGVQRIILNDVTEPYAAFIAGRLNEELQAFEVEEDDDESYFYDDSSSLEALRR